MAWIRDALARKGTVVHTVRVTSTVHEAVVRMETHRVGSVVVLDEDDRVTGVLTERDYLRKIAVPRRDSQNTLVSEIMSTPVLFTGPDETVRHGLRLMTEKRCRHLPVLDDEKLLGLVSIGDLVKEIISEQSTEITHLHRYIQGSY